MANPDNDFKHVDVAKVFRESDSGILKKLPYFVIKLIAKIIRQNEINRILNKYANHSGKDFLTAMISEFNLKVKIEGKENLPDNGKCFFVSNHPFGVIDGLILTHTVISKYDDFRAIANDAFMFIPPLRPHVAAVNVYGRSSKEYIKELENVYNSNVPITHFPAGEVSRWYKRKVQDTFWQKSFITKATSCKRDVVPFYIYGKNSNLFYAVFILRRILGIKLNIELALLPHEMFKKRNKTIKIRIGTPISYQTFSGNFNQQEWAQKVRAYVYELKKKSK